MISGLIVSIIAFAFAAILFVLVMLVAIENINYVEYRNEQLRKSFERSKHDNES